MNNTRFYSSQPVKFSTELVEAPKLGKYFRMDVVLAAETFQPTGSVKFRAAYNIAAQVPHDLIITTSSGNFGQALAYCCARLGKSCIVVMPDNASRIKINAILGYGGSVELVSGSRGDRKNRIAELAAKHPNAYLTSAHDDPLGIQGMVSLGQELSAFHSRFDLIISPIGGGGLAAGVISGIQKSGFHIQVVGAEPALANDAALSLRAGRLVTVDEEAQTIADGARANCLGRNSWPILREGLSTIIEVSEENIKEAVRLLLSLAKIKAEPTGALSIGALITRPEFFYGRSVCCIVSGANVDPDIYSSIVQYR